MSTERFKKKVLVEAEQCERFLPGPLMSGYWCERFAESGDRCEGCLGDGFRVIGEPVDIERSWFIPPSTFPRIGDPESMEPFTLDPLAVAPRGSVQHWAEASREDNDQ